MPDLVVAGVPTAVGSLSPSQGHLTPAAWRSAMGRFAIFDGERGVDIDGLMVADLGDWGVEGLDLDVGHAPGRERGCVRSPRPSALGSSVGTMQSPGPW